MAYLTYATDVKPILNIPSQLDTLAEYVLDAVCDKIEGYTRRKFKVETITYQVLDEHWLDAQMVGGYYRPLIWPVEWVRINGVDQPRVSATLFDLVDAPSTYPWTLEVRGGETCPADVKLATVRAVSHHLTLLRSKAGPVQTTGLDGAPQVSYTFDLPLDVQQVLDRYRTWRV